MTVASGGGVNPKTEASGVAVENDVKPTWNAGVVAPSAKTWTRVGMWVAPSIAIRTEPTRDRESRGHQAQDVRRAAGHRGGGVGAHLGGRVDRLQRRVRRLLRRHYERVSGPDPDHGSYRSFASFHDPDGNGWLFQEVTARVPGRLDPAATTFASASDLSKAMWRAATAHGQHEARTGQADKNWPDWYAEYMVSEQSGKEPPK